MTRQDKENSIIASPPETSRTEPNTSKQAPKHARVMSATLLHPTYVSCPTCHVGYKCHFGTNVIDGVDDGIARVLLIPPCGHKFIIFVDGKPRVRGVERIDRECVVCEHVDTLFLEHHIRTLEEKHQLLASTFNGYNEAFDLLQQIKKAKKELISLRDRAKTNKNPEEGMDG